MRLAFAALTAGFVSLVSPAFAAAADVLVPVREIMDLTVSNWSADVDDWKGVFEGDRLDRLYTKELAALYRDASKKAAKIFESEEPVDPFDYDVVTNSQDGCPLEDLKMEAVGEKDGVTDVVARFRLWACEDNEETKNVVTEVHFDVVQEAGKPVISDIRHVVDGETMSVRDELKSIIAY